MCGARGVADETPVIGTPLRLLIAFVGLPLLVLLLGAAMLLLLLLLLEAVCGLCAMPLGVGGSVGVMAAVMALSCDSSGS